MDKSILFDPFISPNPLANEIKVENLNPDYMFISHGHDDHVADAIAIAKQSDCCCIGSWETEGWLNAHEINNTHSMNIGGKWAFDFGVLKITHAVHSSSFSSGHPGGNPMGCVIQNTESCFYYSGDTALHMDMQLIPKRFKLDFAFLPIGDNYTMDIDDAIEASTLIECNTIIGMHYDTFAPIEINRDEAIERFRKQGKTLILPKIGEQITL
jgi:L-ascorbate metabolism protein UlaG (beta-lactamase superfamily)